jgi:SPP1 family predicted phage head-tail adaptor
MAIAPLSGEEFMLAQQLKAGTSHKITMRYYPDLTTHHRLLFGTRTFEIVSIRNVDEMKVEHELLCREVV